MFPGPLLWWPPCLVRILLSWLRQLKGILLQRVAVTPFRILAKQPHRSEFILALSRVDVTVASMAVESPPSAGASLFVDSAPTVRKSRGATSKWRNSEVGRSAILQAEAVLAAALHDLDSARASIVDYTAAVAIARRHLGLGGFGDDQDA